MPVLENFNLSLTSTVYMSVSSAVNCKCSLICLNIRLGNVMRKEFL